MKYRQYFLSLISILWALACTLSCSEKPGNEGNGLEAFDIKINLPASIEVSQGGQYKFTSEADKGLRTSDEFLLDAGVMKRCQIVEATSTSFTVQFPKSIESGNYNVIVKRGERKKDLGSIYINIVDKLDFKPDAASSIYGMVSCGGKGVAGVVVSDGVEVTATDENGIYQLKSAKKWGYVFISVPSGYEVPAKGILPQFHQILRNDGKTLERIDFSLNKVSGQENHKMFFLGDMHLANRTNDRVQFRDFINDISAYMSSNKGSKMYAVTLGDMTWELYWVKNNYDLNNYLEEINQIKDLQIFHTIGNHDHKMEAVGDFDTVHDFKTILAPTYYSFNIGKVHYIVMDDILAKYDGTSAREYNSELTSEQLAWLSKDLSYVSKDTPIVLAMHAQVHNDSGSVAMDNASELKSILRPYSQVHIVTGHTHKVYNIADNNIFEHNTGAICATWWWSAVKVPGIHVAQDGSPGGYRIMDIQGTAFKWVFKATGAPESYQFRTYDRNSICLSADQYVANATTEGRDLFYSYAKSWASSDSNNYVYINVWNYDPSWKISVSEGGKALEVEQVSALDPLHLISYTAPSINENSKKPTFPTSSTRHFFRVKASSPDSTLEIKVTDRFNNVYTENMKRPKAFNPSVYKLQ